MVVPGLVFPEESVAVAVICSPLVSGVPVDGEFTVAAGFTGADDVAVGVFQRDGTARFGGTGDGFTIRRELQAGRRIRRSGIRIGRVCRRAGVAAVVIIVIPTAATAGACRRRDATRGDNATQYPGQMAAPPASLPDAASRTSVEAIDS